MAQVVHRLKYEEAPSVRRFAPHVPESLSQIIGELLCKDPQQRVATALVLANRLRAMEHVLAALDGESLAPDAVTHVAMPARVSGSATSQSLQGARQTQASPTVGDSDWPAAKIGPAWEDATSQGSDPDPWNRQRQTPGCGRSHW